MSAGAATQGCVRCGAPKLAEVCAACLLQESPEEETFSGYLLEEELGRGGMGTVFRARHRKLDRVAALKLMKPELAQSAEARARFEREARALARLSHPNIVALYDFGEADGEAFLAMELVDGGSVGARAPLPPGEAVRIVAQVCDALSAAHAKGVLHRDIKPENVLLTSDGRVKVTDFGIARLLDAQAPGAQLTATGQALGSAGFMAPESLRGEAPTPQMDIYSAGALLRSLLTGRAPVGDLEELPAQLAPIIRKAMAVDPAARWSSADELARALRACESLASSDELPADERMWMRAVALLGTAAIGVLLLAFLHSLTPVTLREGEAIPLVAITQTRPDGARVARFHFEPGAMLGATAVLGLAAAGFGLLRRHWRKEGLDRPSPDRALQGTRVVLALGAVAISTFILRQWGERSAWITRDSPGLALAPVFGGMFEIFGLYLFLVHVLEAQRIRRPIAREPALLAGMVLIVLPPFFHLLFELTGR